MSAPIIASHPINQIGYLLAGRILSLSRLTGDSSDISVAVHGNESSRATNPTLTIVPSNSVLRGLLGRHQQSIWFRAPVPIVVGCAGSHRLGQRNLWPNEPRHLTPATSSPQSEGAGPQPDAAERWPGHQLGQQTFSEHPPSPLPTRVKIAAGDHHSLALHPDGTVIAGEIIVVVVTVPAAATNLVDLAAGNPTQRGLHSDGVVVTWGDR